MNKYIVINSEDIQKRIEDLKISQKGLNPYLDSIDYYGIESEVNVLKQILSNSKPLEEELGKAFEAGVDIKWKGILIKKQEIEDSKTNYISQLKLDI